LSQLEDRSERAPGVWYVGSHGEQHASCHLEHLERYQCCHWASVCWQL
jgi:hypothetical protein